MPSHSASTNAGDPQVIPRPDWVISDTHFGHANILDYCPWRQTWATTLAEHDSALIAAWRQQVQKDDWVLHLGDACLGTRERLREIRSQLTGRIILVRGNHDRSHSAMREAGFDLVCSAIRIEEGDRHWIGRHNPAAFDIREAESAVRLLHGHSHGNGYRDDTHPAVRAKARDCSLDALRSIAPVTWSDIR